MDSVYQDTLCLQPLIIATQHPPRLLEIIPNDADYSVGNGMDFVGGGSGMGGGGAGGHGGADGGAKAI